MTAVDEDRFLRDAAARLRQSGRDGNEFLFQVANWLEYAAMRGSGMPGRAYAIAVAETIGGPCPRRKEAGHPGGGV